MKKHVLPLLLLLLLTSVPLRDYLWPGAFTSHDLNTHTARIAQYYIALSDGYFPVRWSKNLVSGLGYPIFIYIYPLPYMVGAALYGLIHNFEHTAKIVMGASFILSGLAMYLLLKEFVGTKAALVGSLFYTWAPYRFLLLYVRGAYAETLAYAFVPLALWALVKLSRRKTPFRIGILGLTLALIFLSHNLVAVMAAPLIILFSLFVVAKGKGRLRYLGALMVSVLLALMLSAFILLPDIAEKQYVHFGNLKYYDAHLVTFWQLVRSPWDYGFSLPGSQHDAMSFQVGLAHLIAFPFFTLVLYRNSTRKSTKVFVLGLLFTTLILLFLMLDTKATKWVWRTFDALQVIDFPWRLLGMVTLVTALGIGMGSARAHRWLIALFVVLVILANRNHVRINQKLSFPDSYYRTYVKDTTHNQEFMPVWRADIQEDVVFADRVSVEHGTATISKLQHKAQNLRFTAEATQSAVLRINTLYFPGWQVYVDGRALTLHQELRITSRDKESKIHTDGLMQFTVLPGKHFVDVRLERTDVRLVGDLVSLFGVILSIGMLTLPKTVLPRF